MSTDSLHIPQGLPIDSHATSSGGACNLSNTEVEEHIVVIEEADTGIKQEIPEDINFPDIKAEPDEGKFSGTFSEEGAVQQHQGVRPVERTHPCDVIEHSSENNFLNHPQAWRPHLSA